MNVGKKSPSALISLIPIAFLVGMLYATIQTFGSDALMGGSQISLLATTALCVFIGTTFYRIPWREFEAAVTKNIAGVAMAMVILLIIGALSGVWMVSGVVPALIYYGMQILHPDFFLASGCAICALVSVMTGSSWTTIATIGIALMGIGQAQGFNEGWVAGAIISGAYFGDKISPLSDTTVLASSVTGTPLFTHIKYMLVTTVPTLIITLTIFVIMGLTHEAAPGEQMMQISQALQDKFNLTPWLFMVPVVTGYLIVRKVPSLITLFASTLLACICALIFQPQLLLEIAGEDNLFKGMMSTLFDATSLTAENQMLTELLATRGMGGMLDTVWLILCAMCFGGAMTAGGMLNSLTAVFLRMVRNRTTLVTSTAGSGLFLNFTTADQYISIILTAKMFGEAYRDEGYESRLLSRTTEDAVTVTSVLIPWNTCGMTQATVLNVPTLTYLPYCFFNIISPLMSILVAATGYKIFKACEPRKEMKVPIPEPAE